MLTAIRSTVDMFFKRLKNKSMQLLMAEPSTNDIFQTCQLLTAQPSTVDMFQFQRIQNVKIQTCQLLMAEPSTVDQFESCHLLTAQPSTLAYFYFQYLKNMSTVDLIAVNITKPNRSIGYRFICTIQPQYPIYYLGQRGSVAPLIFF